MHFRLRRPAPARRRLRLLAAVAACVATAGLAGTATAGAATGGGSASWPLSGQNIAGSRSQPAEFTINPGNVAQLKPKWVFTDHGDESATPTVADGVVYFPDFGGYVNAVKAETGALIWQRTISSYDNGAAGAFSRVSPAVYGNELIIGDNFNTAQAGGAHVMAVSRADGHLLWRVQADSHPAAVITASPVVVGNEVIIGVSSNEEVDAQSPAYPCCTFRGSALALNASTGQILWKTYTVPPNAPCRGHNPPSGCGYSGGPVWSTPAVNPATGAVYVGTGNNYTTPDAATACDNQATASLTSDAGCTAPDDYFDSVLPLNLLTGGINWGHKLQGWDAYNLACLSQPPGATWCPSAQSPDYDFGSGPNLLLARGAYGSVRTLVGIGQKSGVYWAFDASSGNLAWHTLVGPGSALGGILWGTAYDLARVYAPVSNPFGTPYTLAGGQADSGGSWAALDPQTGTFDWQVPTPGDAAAMGPVSEADGVLFGGTMAESGDNMFALDAATGKILWSFASGGSVVAGPAIANGTVYRGSGYSRFGPTVGTGNDKFYAFALNGS